MIKGVVRQMVPLALAVGLLWYVLSDVPVHELAAQFRQADYRWLSLAGLLITLYHLLRAARWQLTLQALGYTPTLFRTTVALLAGTTASMVIPGAGELTRCGTLQRTDGVPLAQGIGSVVAERVIDLLMLAGLIGLTFLLEFRRVGEYILTLLTPVVARLTPHPTTGLLPWFILIGALAATGVVIWLLRQRAVREHRFMVRLLGVGRQIGQGFMSLRRVQKPGLFIALTLLSSILTFLTVYLLFFATSQTSTLPPTAALTILTVSSLGGLAVPTQGGIGTYHFLVSRALVLYGFTLAEGAVTATFLHAVVLGLNLFLSSVSFLIVPFLLRRRAQQPDKSAA